VCNYRGVSHVRSFNGYGPQTPNKYPQTEEGMGREVPKAPEAASQQKQGILNELKQGTPTYIVLSFNRRGWVDRKTRVRGINPNTDSPSRPN